ncbi:hypothetical protein HK097_001808 [Rhizophlyctis rosea]|uniref:Trichohyalin-plectin-homology domain-containing protein n=1 Tax=Rhizophlyctis rosea TaxID=64517 RepID=A0AAD5S679_9FUNG|nr:hypothetical protein HK097_001808 [Rhizophlyctis rosea]
MPANVLYARKPAALYTSVDPQIYSTAAGGYIPYDAPRNIHRSPTFVPPVFLSNDDVGRARKLGANVSADEKLREAMLKEKEQLHRQSLERTKDWGTTILGQRRRRLAAREEKLRKTEEEQQKIDAEWAKIRAAERQAAVDRARMMQFMEQSPVRELHAGALIANVLEERDKQIAYKRELKKQLAAEPEQEENFKLVSKERDQQDLRAARQAWVDRRKIAASQREQAAARDEAGRQQRKFDDDYQTFKNSQAVSELRAEAEMQDQKRQNEAKQLQEFIEEQRIWKEEHNKLKEEQTERERLENEKYRAMKVIIGKKRKEVEQGRINTRRNLGQLVAHTTEGTDLEKQRRLDEHIEFGIRQHAEDVARREAAEQAKKMKAETELEKYKVEHARKTIERKKKEHEEDLLTRQHLEDQATQFFQQIEAERQKAERMQDDLKRTHREQIAQNTQTRLQTRIQTNQTECDLLGSQNDLKTRLEAYAKELIKEWESTGRDTKPIIRALRKINTGGGGVVPDGTNPVDTFERLGFTVRWFGNGDGVV